MMENSCRELTFLSLPPFLRSLSLSVLFSTLRWAVEELANRRRTARRRTSEDGHRNLYVLRALSTLFVPPSPFPIFALRSEKTRRLSIDATK